MAGLEEPSTVVPGRTIPLAEVGETADPTYLERWGITFVACGGGWILLISTVLFGYLLWKQPSLALPVGATALQVKDAVDAHKLVTAEWRDSLSFYFDLLVTRTVLPIVTLLLGYLFGRTR